jgi:hypothetical protein
LRMLRAQSPTKIAVSRLPVAYSASEINIERSVPPDVDSLTTIHDLPPYICRLGLYPGLIVLIGMASSQTSVIAPRS